MLVRCITRVNGAQTCASKVALEGQRFAKKVMFEGQRFAWKVVFLYKNNLSRCCISHFGTAHGAGFEQRVARNYTCCTQTALKRGELRA